MNKELSDLKKFLKSAGFNSEYNHLLKISQDIGQMAEQLQDQGYGRQNQDLGEQIGERLYRAITESSTDINSLVSQAMKFIKSEAEKAINKEFEKIMGIALTYKKASRKDFFLKLCMNNYGVSKYIHKYSANGDDGKVKPGEGNFAFSDEDLKEINEMFSTEEKKEEKSKEEVSFVSSRIGVFRLHIDAIINMYLTFVWLKENLNTGVFKTFALGILSLKFGWLGSAVKTAEELFGKSEKGKKEKEKEVDTEGGSSFSIFSVGINYFLLMMIFFMTTGSVIPTNIIFDYHYIDMLGDISVMAFMNYSYDKFVKTFQPAYAAEREAIYKRIHNNSVGRFFAGLDWSLGVTSIRSAEEMNKQHNMFNLAHSTLTTAKEILSKSNLQVEVPNTSDPQVSNRIVEDANKVKREKDKSELLKELGKLSHGDRAVYQKQYQDSGSTENFYDWYKKNKSPITFSDRSEFIVSQYLSMWKDINKYIAEKAPYLPQNEVANLINRIQEIWEDNTLNKQQKIKKIYEDKKVKDSLFNMIMQGIVALRLPVEIAKHGLKVGFTSTLGKEQLFEHSGLESLVKEYLGDVLKLFLNGLLDALNEMEDFNSDVITKFLNDSLRKSELLIEDNKIIDFIDSIQQENSQSLIMNDTTQPSGIETGSLENLDDKTEPSLTTSYGNTFDLSEDKSSTD